MGVQQEIDFESFLRKNGIIMLGFPKINLTLGEIYQTDLDNPRILDNIGDTTDIISAKKTAQPQEPLSLPQLIEQPVDMDLGGLVTFGSKKEVGISIGEKILKFFKIQSSVKKEITESADCKMKSVNFVEMKIAKVEKALNNFIVNERYRSNLRKYFVVIKVYFCKDFEMTLFNMDSASLSMMVDAAEQAKGNLDIDKHTSNKVVLKSTQNVAFGVGLASFEYSILSGEITIAPVSFDDQLILKGPPSTTEENIPKVYLINSGEIA
jgi:hypothetical protein